MRIFQTPDDRLMPADHRPMRFRFLDGLRGWAAVVVLFHHIFVDGLPANSFMADRIFWGNVFFMNGTFAVCLFFVISGFSLSINYLQTGDERGLARMAAGRYLRLAIPIFAICAITYVLLVLNVIPPASQRPSPLDVFATFTPTIKGLLEFSLLKAFVSYSNAENYDPPLWTMFYEFLGSFMVFAVLAVLRSWRLRTWVLGGLFIVLAVYGPFFALFVAGILIADLFRQIESSKSRDLGGAMLCVAGLVLITLPKTGPHLMYVAAPVCVTAGIALFAPARRLFENRLGDFLGWISFPLYLVQAAVIYSFSVRGLDVLASFGLEPAAQRWIVDIATVPVAIFFAILFCPINDLAVTLARRFGSALFGSARQPVRYFGPKSRPA
jgi:peptidoglycan/LPS O-acetylase OafA/YrhL